MNFLTSVIIIMKPVLQKNIRVVGKWVIPLFIIIFAIGCSSIQPLPESTLIITRKYVGTFLDYRRTEGEGLLDPDIFWIKTSLEEEFGKIGVYAKDTMGLILNDRLYIRRTHFNHPVMNSWSYQLESNDQQVSYEIYGTSLDRTRSLALDRLFEIPKQEN